MSKVYQLLEKYYDEHGYTDIMDIVWEMYQDDVITEEQYEEARLDEDLYYELQSLVYERQSEIELEWERENADLERWYRNNV